MANTSPEYQPNINPTWECWDIKSTLKPFPQGVPQTSLNNLLRGLPRLLADASFSNIMLPLQHQMAATLPSTNDDLKSHNPFPRQVEHISLELCQQGFLFILDQWLYLLQNKNQSFSDKWLVITETNLLWFSFPLLMPFIAVFVLTLAFLTNTHCDHVRSFIFSTANMSIPFTNLKPSGCNLYFTDRTPVYLSSIEDKVEIMQSLQLPKKITLRGSDGKCYIMMCKPKVSYFCGF